jgi:hypothetical protein
MGLLDRAFGADKNTFLMHDLTLHWKAVASHYENYLKENEVGDEDKAIMAEIQKRCLGICDKTQA